MMQRRLISLSRRALAAGSKETFHLISSSNRSRLFHISQKRSGSPLFALGALSNSRETQWLVKRTGAPVTEHSPNLQLIRSSEGLDKPYPTEVVVRQEQTKGVEPTWTGLAEDSRTTPVFFSDEEALSVGKAILRANAEEKDGLQKQIAALNQQRAQDQQAWSTQRKRLESEVFNISWFAGLTVLAVTCWETREFFRRRRTESATQPPAMVAEPATPASNVEIEATTGHHPPESVVAESAPSHSLVQQPLPPPPAAPPIHPTPAVTASEQPGAVASKNVKRGGWFWS